MKESCLAEMMRRKPRQSLSVPATIQFDLSTYWQPRLKVVMSCWCIVLYKTFSYALLLRVTTPLLVCKATIVLPCISTRHLWKLCLWKSFWGSSTPRGTNSWSDPAMSCTPLAPNLVDAQWQVESGDLKACSWSHKSHLQNFKCLVQWRIRVSLGRGGYKWAKLCCLCTKRCSVPRCNVKIHRKCCSALHTQ